MDASNPRSGSDPQSGNFSRSANACGSSDPHDIDNSAPTTMTPTISDLAISITGYSPSVVPPEHNARSEGGLPARSVLDLKREIELDEFGVCGYRVGEFGNEAARPVCHL